MMKYIHMIVVQVFKLYVECNKNKTHEVKDAS